MAHRLAGDLAQSYGSSKHYTELQIRTAFAKTGISEKYIDLAFAEFLQFDAYSIITGRDKPSYDLSRELFRKYRPEQLDHSPAPAPVNAYIKSMSGL
jgi:hypothetical protein